MIVFLKNIFRQSGASPKIYIICIARIYYALIFVNHRCCNKMAESSGAKSTKESHSSVSSSGEASGGQKASPQSSLVLTPQYTEDASSTPTKVTIASPTSSLPTNVPPLATQNAPSSSDTPSPVARRAHNTDSAANLADSEGESKQ